MPVFRFPIQRLKALFGFGPTEKPLARTPYTAGTSYVGIGEQYGSPAWEYYHKQMKLAIDRLHMYAEYDQMDDDDIVASALDIYASEVTQLDINTGKTIWIKSRNAQVQELGEQLFEEIGVEDIVFGIARDLAKFGDDFSAIIQGLREDGTPGGVVGLISIDPRVIHRHTDELHRLRGFSIGPQPNPDKTSSPWDYLHFRLLGKSRRIEYGYSMLAPARRVYRRLMLMEAAMTIYRLRRTPDRWAFYFKGLEGMRPDERYRILNDIRRDMRKKMTVDPVTGAVRSELDPLSVDEDLFLDDATCRVERLIGSPQIGHVLDVDYMRKRLAGCLRIPPDYLGFSDARGGSINAKSPLVDQDVQFARVCKRLQRGLIAGFVRLHQINLAWRMIDPLAPDNDFTVHMVPISYLDELEKAETVETRSRTIAALQDIGRRLKIDEKRWLEYVMTASGFPEELFTAPGTTLIPIEGTVELTEREEELLRNLTQSSEVRELLEKLFQTTGAGFPGYLRSRETLSPVESLPQLGGRRERSNPEDLLQEIQGAVTQVVEQLERERGND